MTNCLIKGMYKRFLHHLKRPHSASLKSPTNCHINFTLFHKIDVLSQYINIFIKRTASKIHYKHCTQKRIYTYSYVNGGGVIIYLVCSVWLYNFTEHWVTFQNESKKWLCAIWSIGIIYGYCRVKLLVINIVVWIRNKPGAMHFNMVGLPSQTWERKMWYYQQTTIHGEGCHIVQQSSVPQCIYIYFHFLLPEVCYQFVNPLSTQTIT